MGLIAAPAHAWPQTLVGVRAGALAPGLTNVDVGPSLGVSASLAVLRQLAAELAFDQSVHFFPKGQAALSALSLGFQVRLDAAPAVPFLGVALSGSRYSPPAGEAVLGLSGALFAGALFPLGEHWVLGAEVRYGAQLTTGDWPTSTAVCLLFAWRSGEF